MEAALFAAPLAHGGATSAGIRRSALFGWLQRETPPVKSDPWPLDVFGNKNESEDCTVNFTKDTSGVDTHISTIQADIQDPHLQGYEAGFAEGRQQGWALGHEQGRLDAMMEAEAARGTRVVTLYVPEFVNGVRVLRQTQSNGRYILDLLALHGRAGAKLAFRKSRDMQDKHSEAADDGRVLTGTLRGGWLETEVEVKAKVSDCSQEFNSGHGHGFQEGHKSGFMDGHKQGAEQGTEYGYAKGFAEGAKSGEEKQHKAWYLKGYVHGWNRFEYDSPEDKQARRSQPIAEGAVERSAVSIRFASKHGFGCNEVGASEAVLVSSSGKECAHSTAGVKGDTIKDASSPELAGRRRLFQMIDHWLNLAIVLLIASCPLCIISVICRCGRFINHWPLHGSHISDIDEPTLQDMPAAELSQHEGAACQKTACEGNEEKPICISDEKATGRVQSSTHQCDAAVLRNDVDVVNIYAVESGSTLNPGACLRAGEAEVNLVYSAAISVAEAATCSDCDAARVCAVQSNHAAPSGAEEGEANIMRSADLVLSAADQFDEAASCDDYDATGTPIVQRHHPATTKPDDDKAGLVLDAAGRCDVVASRDDTDASEAPVVQREPASKRRVQSLVQRFEIGSPRRCQEATSTPRVPMATNALRSRALRRSSPATVGSVGVSVDGWQEWGTRLDKLGGALRGLSSEASAPIIPQTIASAKVSATP